MSDDTNTNPTPENETPVENPTQSQEPAKPGRQMTFHVLEDGTIRADFGPDLEALHLNPAAVPETIQAAAVTEGLISRLRGYTSKLVDNARTPAALREAVAKGMENLLAGVWKIERTGAAAYTIEVEAAFEFRRMRAEAKGETFTGTLEEAAENFAKLTEAQVKDLKALPRYQLAFAQVKARRQAEKAAKLAAQVSADEDNAPF